jgi:hypothetical protein
MHRHRQARQPWYSMQPVVYTHVVTIWRVQRPPFTAVWNLAPRVGPPLTAGTRGTRVARVQRPPFTRM